MASSFLKAGWWWGLLFALIALVAITVLFLASLLVVPQVFPLLTSGDSGFNPDRQLAYGQLLVAFIGIAIAAGLGFVAVQQLVAGRDAVQQGALTLKEERQARDEATQSLTRQVLSALYVELNQNRVVALFYEQRLEMVERATPLGATPSFSRRVFDQLMSGPLWAVPNLAPALVSIAQAYDKTIELNGIVATRRWLPIPLAGGLLALFGRGEDTSWVAKWRSLLFFTGGLAVIGIVGTHTYVFASGRATAVRVAIETAMEAVYMRIAPEGARLDWAEVDQGLDPRFRVVPLRNPTLFEHALGAAGVWLAETFRL